MRVCCIDKIVLLLTLCSYGWNFWVCVLCIKMVIYLWKSRQYCDKLRNYMTKNQNTHLEILPHRVRISHCFYHITYFRPPWGPGANAYFQDKINTLSLSMVYNWNQIQSNSTTHKKCVNHFNVPFKFEDLTLSGCRSPNKAPPKAPKCPKTPKN